MIHRSSQMCYLFDVSNTDGDTVTIEKLNLIAKIRIVLIKTGQAGLYDFGVVISHPCPKQSAR